ncbi:hypothetical protein TanjilG_18370 [Lupinus angustifolius]|uniref:Uncharacterized protein n=1 Tax=Lupinus angustifolius TaxID=3871 RepID=A0A1J7H2M0_LUPAN|nr:hypothetical protein TanjilG_18370 [Lupinus angustifolius]
MQTLLPTATRAANFTLSSPSLPLSVSSPRLPGLILRPNSSPSLPLKYFPSLTHSSSSFNSFIARRALNRSFTVTASSQLSPPFASSNDELEKAKLDQVSKRLEKTASFKNGIMNLLRMSAAILGMHATVGLLVAKALTSSANPYYQGISPGLQSGSRAGRIFGAASANTILSHFLGLVFSLELLRSVTLPPSEATPFPKFA